MSSPFWSFDPFLMFFPFMLLLSFVFVLLPSQNYYQTKMLVFFSGLENMIKILFPSPVFVSVGFLSIIKNFFMVFSFINIISLLPYIFSPLAHISLAFSLSGVMWFSCVFYQLIYFLEMKMIHLTPKGTPLWLLAFMVLVEMVSQMIRPITLSVRLAANLTAGHLILSLLSTMNMGVSFFSQMPLFFLEVLVSLVQPFVFCLLVFLYFSE